MKASLRSVIVSHFAERLHKALGKEFCNSILRKRGGKAGAVDECVGIPVVLR